MHFHLESTSKLNIEKLKTFLKDRIFGFQKDEAQKNHKQVTSMKLTDN